MSRLSRILAVTAVTVAIFLLGVQGKQVRKRRNLSSNVTCIESGRFYRNPNRSRGSEHWHLTECAKYYLCLEGDVFEFKCSQGLLFDVTRQLCDMQQNVHNCDIVTEAPVLQPLLEKATCANETHLGCANGECVPAEYFCDGSNDCPDNSDEGGWCDDNNDPNTALPCEPELCQLPQCFCSENGTDIPGNLVRSQTPQMITLTLNGAVNHENWDVYTKHLFTPERRNPNGCPIKATFFIPHLYTNYRHVQKLWNDGHEIAVNSITHRGPGEWWSNNATIEDWFDEMVGQANVISKFANVRMEDFRGLRVPYLSVGWNRQFLMMQEFGFVYDASVVAPLNDPPYWPYTLDYKMPHSCPGIDQQCPTRSYAGTWEMVINPLKKANHSCATLDYCPSTLSGDEVFNLLMDNFKRHYLTNRAPFGIHLNASWLKTYDYMVALKMFIDELLKLPDVYFVTEREVIDWIRRPTPVLQLKKYQPWQCKNTHKEFEEWEIACVQPNTCKLSSKVLEHDKYMITCNECPRSYPWIRNEFGLE